MYVQSSVEFQISMQSVYSAFEGTAMRQCREFNSDFTWIVFYGSVGSIFGPFLAAITIEDAVQGSGGKILKSEKEKTRHVEKLAINEKSTFFVQSS